jgi:hypothetical protein
MPPSHAPSGARKSARAPRELAILPATVAGASLNEIAKARNLAPKRVESLLRDELRERWVASARHYARPRIARLETSIAKLAANAEEGDLAAIDRLPRVLDRLDKYLGFSKITPAPTEDYAEIHKRLMAKLNVEVQKLPPRERVDP